MLSQLGEAKVLSTVDLHSGYLHCILDEESGLFTTFAIPFGAGSHLDYLYPLKYSRKESIRLWSAADIVDDFFIDNQVISFIYNSHNGFLTCRPGIKALDRIGQVDVVFIDFSKAFDLVCHDILLTKLYKYGFRGDLLDWCRDYLTDRQQRVVVKGEVSDWLPVTSGVPQGSFWELYFS